MHFGGRFGVGTVFAEASRLLNKLGLNDKWADILSMSNGFFKRFGCRTPQATGSAITGTISGGSMDVQAFQNWRRKGGIFRSDRTGRNYVLLGARQIEALNDGTSRHHDARAHGRVRRRGIGTDGSRCHSRHLKGPAGQLLCDHAGAIRQGRRNAATAGGLANVQQHPEQLGRHLLPRGRARHRRHRSRRQFYGTLVD